ncbi:hypothetical protein M407DRAFT_15642 [Tulasnella calospora MUT 4182]|uniref:Nuclear condensin complex subunit 3 C-terminal domain-containing protein n=1 Tax=Tulasnella calospora MUT 4182 TaxID=1051891 RepID=A0A0C3Q2U9_9AGAM|nr:hypothetical protein M407DRAFT_15642 [Tulasnella calospora MUT 4182]
MVFSAKLFLVATLLSGAVLGAPAPQGGPIICPTAYTPGVELPELIAPIFQQAQFSLANHRKNVVSLHKVHEQAAQITQSLGKGKGLQLTGEAAFNKAFISMVNRILPIKKGVSQADKSIKFVAAFVRYTSEKAAAEEKEKNGETDEDETTASRFVALLVKHLLRGFQAKDKNVRLRVLQCIAEMISSVGEMEEDLYLALRSALLERIRDKEAPARVQAVIALAKLQGDNPEEMEEDEQSVSEVLVDVLQHDPSPEVRRAALLNIAASKVTLDSILSRTRDQDTTIRKLLYAHVLAGLPHPKLLTIAQREEVVKNGLKDRESTVRAAAGRLVGGWVDLFEGGLVEALTNLRQLLKMFDLIGSEEVAQEALLSAFITRPDLFDSVEFGDTYWEDLTPEKAFLARVFVDHCVSIKDTSRVESSLPVVTALAFKIQHCYNALLELSKEMEAQDREDSMEVDDGDSQADREERRSSMEFTVAQLLKLAVNLDYSDEIGRRKMFGLVREITGQESLPEGLVARCLDVLRKLSPSERDLIRLVVEVIQELRDLARQDEPEPEPVVNGDESQFGDDRTEGGRPPAPAPREITPETQARIESIDLRCLVLCIGMLERVNSTLQDNSALHGLLPELIIPSVRSKDPLLRERGLISLGLCSLIDKKIALSSFTLFVQQSQVATEEIKKRCMETVFDLLMVYESEFFKAENRIEILLLQIMDQDSPEVQAIACEGVAKLMLSGIVADDRLLRSLVILYLTPETEDNQALRQCLSYFFPVFCYSSPLNQRRMQHEYRESLDEDQEMIPPSQITLLFVDWTDPQKAVEMKDQATDTGVQAELASDIIKALLIGKYPVQLEPNIRADLAISKDKKILCQMLGRLYIPADLDNDKALQLKILTSALMMVLMMSAAGGALRESRERRLTKDATSWTGRWLSRRELKPINKWFK